MMALSNRIVTSTSAISNAGSTFRESSSAVSEAGNSAVVLQNCNAPIMSQPVSLKSVSSVMVTSKSVEDQTSNIGMPTTTTELFQ